MEMPTIEYPLGAFDRLDEAHPSWLLGVFDRFDAAARKIITREYESDFVQAALSKVPEEDRPRHVKFFVDYLHDKLVRDNQDLLAIALLRRALRFGDVSWQQRILRDCLEAVRVARHGPPVATETAWHAIREKGKGALGPHVEDRIAMLRSIVDRHAPRHARRFGNDRTLGANDLDRHEVDRKAARDGRKSRRQIRVEFSEDEPTQAAGAGAVSPEEEMDRRQRRQILDRVIADACATAQDRALIDRVLVDGLEPGEACRGLGLERRSWNRVYMKMKRAAERFADTAATPRSPSKKN